jgi:hypothetical protein
MNRLSLAKLDWTAAILAVAVMIIPLIPYALAQ